MPLHPKAKEFARPPHATWHDMHVMAVWDQRYAELVDFKERFGHCIVPQHWEENSKLGLWVRDQRVLRKQGRLPAEKTSLLDKLGFVWIAKPTRNPHAKWEEMLSTECQIQLNKIMFAWVYDEKELRAMFNDKFHSKAKTRPASLVPALDQYAQKMKRAEAA